MDLQGKPGHCVVTVKSSAEREKILDAGIRISGKQVLCEISGVDLTHLHVFGCPVGLQYSKLCAALGQFGRIVGSPQQKKYCLRDWKSVLAPLFSAWSSDHQFHPRLP